ncbi:MAG: hypothetical protein D4R88_01865 [Methanosarcinales archaeon]|nr:MAG: hypothetical protein D4R88_01865 [Methanosarcinales archaeon]
MKETRIIALMIALTGIRTVLILGGILPPFFVNSSVNTLFLLANTAIIGYTGWIFSRLSFKEAAIKGGIVTLVSFITVCIGLFIGIIMHKPVLGVSYASQLDLLLNVLILGIINVMVGAVIAVIGAIIGRKFMKK